MPLLRIASAPAIRTWSRKTVWSPVVLVPTKRMTCELPGVVTVNVAVSNSGQGLFGS